MQWDRAFLKKPCCCNGRGGITTKIFFFTILILVFLQRILEARFSKRNVATIIDQGGHEQTSNDFGIVLLMHLSWFVAMVCEVYLFNRPFILPLAIIGVIGAVTGQLLRYQSMKALGTRWTLPIMVIPNMSVVDKGVYKYLRHPNWLGVIIEIATIPLIHTAYLTAICYSLMNAWVMKRRVYTEEKALSDASNYQEVFKNRPRFIPGFRKVND